MIRVIKHVMKDLGNAESEVTKIKTDSASTFSNDANQIFEQDRPPRPTNRCASKRIPELDGTAYTDSKILLAIIGTCITIGGILFFAFLISNFRGINF